MPICQPLLSFDTVHTYTNLCSALHAQLTAAMFQALRPLTDAESHLTREPEIVDIIRPLCERYAMTVCGVPAG